MKYKIVLFGVKEDTNQILDKFKSNIDLIITLDKNESKNYHISGKANIKNNSIETYESNDYKLSSPECKSFFQNNDFDLGIVVGWQRLIPEFVLSQFKYGIYGFHACPLGLPYGKGRSPSNWAIILGYNHVYNHLFQYNPNPDDGDIFNSKKIDILPWDNIFTLKEKILIHQFSSIKKLINNFKEGEIKLKKQNGSIFESFFPKRKPSDGKIFLYNTTESIFNLIRGCSYPFPGAFFSSPTGEKIIIWDAVPFSFEDLYPTNKVGEVVKIYDNSFILKTIDGSLLIEKWEGEIKNNLILK